MSTTTDKALLIALIDATARRIAARDTCDQAMDAYDTECEWAEREHYRAMARVGLGSALRELAKYMGPRFNTIGVADIRHLADDIEANETEEASP